MFFSTSVFENETDILSREPKSIDIVMSLNLYISSSTPKFIQFPNWILSLNGLKSSRFKRLIREEENVY